MVNRDQQHPVSAPQIRRPEERREEESSLPYVLPFAFFFCFLALSTQMEAVFGRWEFVLRAVFLAATLVIFSRRVIDLRVSRPLLSIALGVVVFFVWIGPDLQFPGYRNHWLFQNSITGELKPGIAPQYQSDMLVLAARSLRAIVLVPIIEELFWRAWLLRWVINSDFYKVALGAFSWTSMLVTAALFGSEHGAFWDVGILAGLAYNLLMVRTKRLGDCVLAHGVTNACLSAYVILYGRWEYWP